ncbi:Uncharacterised protein [uncultured archaeon]|nr:Uncharacterised protein [uncultured archaeon]
MYLLLLQAIVLYLISGYLHRSLSSSASKPLYVALMLPGTVIHESSHAAVALLTGASIKTFSVMPSGDTLGRVEHTKPKIPVIGDFAISVAPLIGCPAVLVLAGYFLGLHFNYSPGSFDILTETRYLLQGTLYFITALDYFSWKTYVFLYLALALGAGAAPSRSDVTSMLPGLVIIVVAAFALNYYGINIPYLYIVFSGLSAALSIAVVPLLAVTGFVAILKLVAVLK